MPHTPDTVRDFLLSQLESDEPEAVLAVLKANNGKQLTKRLLAKLPGGEERWRLSQLAAMTHLETRDYHRSGGKTGISLLLSYQITHARIRTDWIEVQNPAYFQGRRERNASRTKTTDDPIVLQAMANTLNRYAEAKAKLDEAKQQLDLLTESTFSADRYDWERLCGAREV